jgi:hypothetical protein
MKNTSTETQQTISNEYTTSSISGRFLKALLCRLTSIATSDPMLATIYEMAIYPALHSTCNRVPISDASSVPLMWKSGKKVREEPTLAVKPNGIPG